MLGLGAGSYFLAQPANAGSGIDYDGRSVSSADLNTRSVAAVAQVFRRRHRERSSHASKLYSHVPSSPSPWGCPGAKPLGG